MYYVDQTTDTAMLWLQCRRRRGRHGGRHGRVAPDGRLDESVLGREQNGVATMHIRFVLAALVALTPVVLAQPEKFDLVIINGRVIDGTGAPARMASIGIRDGKITRIGGAVAAAQGATVIEAAGEVVAPGFIDVHTHADDLADRLCREFIRMGVTTIVA